MSQTPQTLEQRVEALEASSRRRWLALMALVVVVVATIGARIGVDAAHVAHPFLGGAEACPTPGR